MQRKNDKLFPERNFWSKDFAITFDEAEKGQLKNHKEWRNAYKNEVEIFQNMFSKKYLKFAFGDPTNTVKESQDFP